MTVKELIEQLSKFAPESPVATEHHIGDITRTVCAEPFLGVYDDNAYLNFARQLILPQAEEDHQGGQVAPHPLVAISTLGSLPTPSTFRENSHQLLTPWVRENSRHPPTRDHVVATPHPPHTSIAQQKGFVKRLSA